ncbi:hypothetical protein [Streptomyces sp. NPDC049744]|uniref:DUF6907 domain-containing protein n=1 Tax=Streptomyces sp. NPDC049744 TaxID=3154359 RepID=UPI0034150FF7
MSKHQNENGTPAQRGGGPLPTFGPFETQGGVDELEPAIAEIRVAFALTRTQLLTVLAMGFAGLGADRTPESLTDDEVRREVEGQLAAEAIIEIDRQMEANDRTVFPPDQQQAMDALGVAVDRAFAWPEEPSRIVQRPRYGDGVVTLQTEDSGEVTVREPAWCIGHDGQTVGRLADVTHRGPAVAADLDVDELLPARISWSPFGVTLPEPQPIADVADLPPMGPDELRDLAAEVALHAGRLYSLANQLDRIRRGQS